MVSAFTRAASAQGGGSSRQFTFTSTLSVGGARKGPRAAQAKRLDERIAGDQSPDFNFP
jgi:hypothetical protein